MSTQNQFAAALLDRDAPVPAGLSDPQGRPAGKRFDVYRNNVAASLIGALETGFPVVARLVGSDFFRAMAGAFLKAHLPDDPRLPMWGGRFPGFLARFQPVAHLPYLPDIARLELGLRQSYHAADCTVLEIAGKDPADILALKPFLAPATLVLASRFPVLTIWEKNAGKPGLRVDWTPQTVLITRPAFDPAPHLLPPGGEILARHLKGRLSISDAVTAVQAIDPSNDPAPALTLFLRSGALTLDPPPLPEGR